DTPPPAALTSDTCRAPPGTGPRRSYPTRRSPDLTTATASGSLHVYECATGGGGCVPTDISLTGSGARQLAANPASLDFGAVPVNTTASRDVTITVDSGYYVDSANGEGINFTYDITID